MIHTPASRKKLSDMRKGSANPFFGRTHSPETREKLAGFLRAYQENRAYDLLLPTVRIPSSAVELAYIAGIIDGEGSIRFRLKRYPFVAIYNSDPALKLWLEERTGIDATWSDYRGRVPGWKWVVGSASNVYVLCRSILPILVIKRNDAEAVIQYLENKYGQRLTEVVNG